MRGFALTSESTHPDVNAAVPEMARVLALQQARLAQWWERVALPVSYAVHAADVPRDPGIVLVSFADQLYDPDALAYHTTDAAGRPCIFVGVLLAERNAPQGANWIHGPDGLLSVISHEICETAINPYVNHWVDITGNIEAPEEVCDWTQGDSYEEEPDSGWYVSNFVGPRFFSNGPGPYDPMGVCSRKTLRPGGYYTPRTGGPGGNTTAVFGARPHEGGMAEWKRNAKMKAGTRCARWLGL